MSDDPWEAQWQNVSIFFYRNCGAKRRETVLEVLAIKMCNPYCVELTTYAMWVNAHNLLTECRYIIHQYMFIIYCSQRNFNCIVTTLQCAWSAYDVDWSSLADPLTEACICAAMDPYIGSGHLYISAIQLKLQNLIEPGLKYILEESANISLDGWFWSNFMRKLRRDSQHVLKVW